MINTELETLEEELYLTREVLRAALSDRNVEQKFVMRELHLLRRKHALEKSKRQQAYITVARLRSELAEEKLKYKRITCTPDT